MKLGRDELNNSIDANKSVFFDDFPLNFRTEDEEDRDREDY